MNRNQFYQTCLSNGLTLSAGQLEQLQRYYQLLVSWNEKMNLTAISEEEQVWDKHFMDCIYPTFVTSLGNKVADIGSGAGFPGMVWAICYPNHHFTLIEPTGKRVTFLQEVVNQCHLDNVTLVNKRSEDCKELLQYFDTVTARAVANLPILLELCTPLLKVGGNFIALKGSKANDELFNSQHALKELGCEYVSECTYTCEDQGQHITLIIKKVNQCSSKYPRNYAQIKKKPL